MGRRGDSGHLCGVAPGGKPAHLGAGHGGALMHGVACMGWVTASSAMFGLMAVAVLCSCGRDTSGPGQPQVTIAPSSLRFDARTWDVVAETLVVGNSKTATLRVDSITADVPWLCAHPDLAFEVPAGATMRVAVVADPEGRSVGSHGATLKV